MKCSPWHGCPDLLLRTRPPTPHLFSNNFHRHGVLHIPQICTCSELWIAVYRICLCVYVYVCTLVQLLGLNLLLTYMWEIYWVALRYPFHAWRAHGETILLVWGLCSTPVSLDQCWVIIKTDIAYINVCKYTHNALHMCTVHNTVMHTVHTYLYCGPATIQPYLHNASHPPCMFSCLSALCLFPTTPGDQ